MDIEKICINCMNSSLEDGVCPVCGYQEGTYHPKIHHLEPLTILNARYLLGRVLGEGGFGITYMTYDLVNQERVAIKEFFVNGLLVRENTKTVLVDESVSTKAFYEECKAKFIQEASTLRRLEDKSGIVSIYDDFAENNTHYIVMEYLDGVSLSRFLQENGGRIPLQQAFHILRPAMKSLMELHSNSIYHRDISPDNIQYLKSGYVKIMDLGGSKDMINQVVRSHIVSVKHGYAPPEQYITRYKIGPWMDVYAMAATIYRCITGAVPPQSTSRLQEEDTLKPPSAFGVQISPAAEQVILKGMALSVDDRYLNMIGFYKALKEVLQAEEPESDPEPESEAGPEQDDDSDQGSGPDPGYGELIEELNRKKPSYGWIIALGIVLIIICGLLSYYVR